MSLNLKTVLVVVSGSSGELTTESLNSRRDAELASLPRSGQRMYL